MARIALGADRPDDPLVLSDLKDGGAAHGPVFPLGDVCRIFKLRHMVAEREHEIEKNGKNDRHFHN